MSKGEVEKKLLELVDEFRCSAADLKAQKNDKIEHEYIDKAGILCLELCAYKLENVINEVYGK